MAAAGEAVFCLPSRRSGKPGLIRVWRGQHARADACGPQIRLQLRLVNVNVNLNLVRILRLWTTAIFFAPADNANFLRATTASNLQFVRFVLHWWSCGNACRCSVNLICVMRLYIRARDKFDFNSSRWCLSMLMSISMSYGYYAWGQWQFR
jgi:hypothetical protein